MNEEIENEVQEEHIEEIQSEETQPEETQPEETQLEETQTGDGEQNESEQSEEKSEEQQIDPEEPFIDKSVYESKSKHKKIKKIFAISGTATAAVIVLSYIIISVWFMFHFGNGTYIDGENVSYKALSYVKDNQDTFINGYSLTVTMRNSEEYTILPADIGLNIETVTGAEEIKKLQNGFLWFLYINSEMKDYTTEYKITYDENLLEQYIANMSCTQTKNMEEPENAYISIVDGEAEIVSETEGTVIDSDELKENIINAVENLETCIDLTDSDCYIPADITSESDEIISQYNDLQKYLEMVITYEIDEVSWTLDAKTFGDWLYYEDDSWHFKTYQVKKYVKEVAEKYDTVETVRDFYTYSGKLIQQEGKSYGWAIDVTTEALELKSALSEGISQTRTPVFLQTGAAYNYFNDIGNTYVEVDLTNQKVYLIVDGDLILETNCVSGCVTAGNATPDGLYAIKYKQSPAVLRGDDYESYVTYWMPFNRGIGLHDATWRSKFGGNIYYSSGSHGCINLPKSSAATIYNYVSAGTPVICYY